MGAEVTHYVPLSLRDKYMLQEPVSSPEGHGPSANIRWEPDWAVYKQRETRRLATENLPRSLPPRWPQRVKSPLTWSGDMLISHEDYVYHLNEQEQDEIYASLQHFKSLKLEPHEVNPQAFPLPTLASKLRKLTLGLHQGRGFFVIRGLDPKKSSGEDNTLIYLGISSYIGDERGRQDQDGSMIAHLMDASSKSANREKVQSVYTNVAQPFHNDVFCDILALQTRSCATSGGRSIIASAYTVYNELAATRPDLIHTLARDDWTFDTFGRNPAYHQRPLLFHHASHLIMNFSRRLLTGSSQSPRTPGIPPITEAQAEALDAVHYLAEKHSLAMTMQPGDLRYINNHAILHCRDSFQDSESAKRHIVRLWLRSSELKWEMPPGLKLASDRVYAMLGGEVEERWDLDPVLDDNVLLNAKRSCGQG